MPTTTTKTIDVGASARAYHAAATASIASGMIHISGQPGTDPSGKVPHDYESQIHLALLNLRKIILAAGCSIADILALRVYVVNYDPRRRLHTRPIRRFLAGHRPAVTLVPVQQLAVEEWLFEIEAVVGTHTTKPNQIARPLSQAPESVDVVIFGAGLAGLTAASQILAAGLSCVVLEARSRVGGRTWSRQTSDGEGIVDLGAAWINDTNQSKMLDLARRFGLELIEQNTDGKCVLETETGDLKQFPYGELPPFDEPTKANVAFIRDLAEADCQKLDCAYPQDSMLDSMSFAAYLRENGATEEAFRTATVWTRAMLGHEPENVSALFFLNYCKSGGGLLQMRSDRKHGGQYLRLRQGTQSFAQKLSESLPHGTIRLSTEVSSIQQAERILVTATSDSSFQARKVISAIPPPVLKRIQFRPPLPLQKQLLLQSYSYGFYQKVMIVFKTPFWVARGFCGLIQSFRGPAAVIRDTSSPADDKHVLTCFMSGMPGEEWSKNDKKERERLLLEQIGALYGHPHVHHDVVEFVTLPWSEEEFTGHGCPSPALCPGVLSSVGVDIRSAVGNVHFVGTETSEEWKGYMEGAVRSGERGAKEVIDGLTKIVAKL